MPTLQVGQAQLPAVSLAEPALDQHQRPFRITPGGRISTIGRMNLIFSTQLGLDAAFDRLELQRYFGDLASAERASDGYSEIRYKEQKR